MPDDPIQPVRLGDDATVQPVETWMVGRTVVEVLAFEDGSGRWRQLTLDDGSVVQMLFSAPWLILEPLGE